MYSQQIWWHTNWAHKISMAVGSKLSVGQLVICASSIFLRHCSSCSVDWLISDPLFLETSCLCSLMSILCLSMYMLHIWALSRHKSWRFFSLDEIFLNIWLTALNISYDGLRSSNSLIFQSFFSKTFVYTVEQIFSNASQLAAFRQI